jgi:hypothetical protein
MTIDQLQHLGVVVVVVIAAILIWQAVKLLRK